MLYDFDDKPKRKRDMAVPPAPGKWTYIFFGTFALLILGLIAYVELTPPQPRIERELDVLLDANDYPGCAPVQVSTLYIDRADYEFDIRLEADGPCPLNIVQVEVVTDEPYGYYPYQLTFSKGTYTQLEFGSGQPPDSTANVGLSEQTEWRLMASPHSLNTERVTTVIHFVGGEHP